MFRPLSITLTILLMGIVTYFATLPTQGRYASLESSLSVPVRLKASKLLARKPAQRALAAHENPAALVEPDQLLDSLERVSENDTETQLAILKAAAKTPGAHLNIANLALRYAVKQPVSGSAFDQYVFPMGTYELYLENVTEKKDIIPGTIEVLRAHENAATRRLILKYFAVKEPDLAAELQEDIRYLNI